MSAIKTAAEQFAVRQAGGYRNFIASLTLRQWGTFPNWEIGGKPIHAWVCRSSWVVTCDVCNEQDFIEPGQPFYCPNCCNGKNDGRARLVIWPATGDRKKIEWLLSRRVVPQTRNWLLNETIADLEREQRDHGEL